MAAVRDGTFATAAGDINEHVVVEFIDVLPSAADDVAPALLRGTSRLLDALASPLFSSSLYRECVVPACGVAGEHRACVRL
ncbi:hypothetical protein BC739_007847 [Kutzneria viridogrisea]|uniref:Uncharacterized protein n=1 Tax=Kutzneria viridogrisea TaxID=47990 RepID=A0ABR6BV81_9PSEU|nr:hypothetical protein [Kutzneria viridogrisea]